MLSYVKSSRLRSDLDPTTGPSDFTQAGIIGPAGLPARCSSIYRLLGVDAV